MDDTTPATAGRQPDWATIRDEYENRLFHPATICKRHGVSENQLRYRRQKEGWFNSRARAPTTAELVTRMMKVLERQVWQLEKSMDEPVDKQVNALAVSVKSLDKLIEFGAAKPNVAPASRTDMAEMRAKLVERERQFNARFEPR